MSNKLTLKFKSALPLHLEHILVQKYGFEIKNRLQGVHIVMSRPSAKAKITPITQNEMGHLVARCEGIIGLYDSPKDSAHIIRARLRNLAFTLRPSAREFVLEYTDEEFPEDKGSNVVALSDLR